MLKKRKITRSYQDRWLVGVLSGLAHYFGWNVTVVRVLYIILMVITGIIPAVVLYLILFTIMPSDPEHPGLLDFFKTIGALGTNNRQDRHEEQQRRTLTDVEEHDIKKNRRS